MCKYLTYKEWKHCARGLSIDSDMVSTLPIRNGNGMTSTFSGIMHSILNAVSTLPIRNGNKVGVLCPHYSTHVSTLPIRNANTYQATCQ